MRRHWGDWSALAIASRWRIESAFVAAPLGLWFAHPTRASVAQGLPLVIAGLALRCWARGYLERRAWLTRGGPYALVRHPLYVGSFAIGLGFCWMANVPVFVPIFAVLFAAAYVPKAIREENFLRARYGEEFESYASNVAAIVPRFHRPAAGTEAAGSFAWQRVLRHREYFTWMGALVGLAVMMFLAR